MQKPDQEFDKEVSAIGAIGSALSSLGDDTARQRVLLYVVSRFFPDASFGLGRSTSASIARVQTAPAPKTLTPTSDSGTVREIAGVAKLTDAGDLKITARDLKARSGLDAAVRLAHIAIYAHEYLTGRPLSSRDGLTPLLKEWRLYDGNSRARLSKDRGIVRNEDSLSLDAHARADAEKFVSEVLDSDIQGTWKAR